MSAIESVSPLERGGQVSWRQYLLDSTLAFMGVMGVTGLLFVLRLYPRIPNISIRWIKC